MDVDEQLITVNVGGVLFEPKKSWLMNSSLFKSMFEDLSEELALPFIDTSGEAFVYILEILKNPKYITENDPKLPFPKKYERDLDYFLMDKTKIKLEDSAEEIKVLRETLFSTTSNINKTNSDYENRIVDLEIRLKIIGKMIESMVKDSNFDRANDSNKLLYISILISGIGEVLGADLKNLKERNR